MRSACRLCLPLLLCVATGAAQSSAAQENAGQNPVIPDLGQAPSLEQEQAAAQNRVVSLQDEPHHQLVLQNDFVRVYTLGISPNDTTLMHRHDLPYVAVNFGVGEVINIEQGKSETHLKLQDGQVSYSAGGFAHVLRTDPGLAFRNVMIELIKPQGSARNLCRPVIEGPIDCPEQAKTEQRTATEAKTAEAQTKRSTQGARAARHGPPGTASAAVRAEAQSPSTSARVPPPSDDDVRYFETDEIQIDVITVSQGRDYVEESPNRNALLVALTNADLIVTRAGQHSSFLHDGDILWLPAGEPRRASDFLGTRSNFLLVFFKNSDTTAKP